MKYVKFIISLLILSSCIEVEFKQPMPPNKGTTLEKLPEEIISYFMSLDKVSTGNSKLDISEFNSDFDWNDPLPEEIIFKKWKGSYFLNQKEGERWQLLMVKDGSNKSFNVYHIDGSNSTTIDKLKSLTKVEEVFSDDGDLERVILDPSLKEFKKIIKSGAFEQIDLFDN